jgi:hypothetical protein
MQKRKARSSNDSMQLPLTISDLSNHNHHQQQQSSYSSSSRPKMTQYARSHKKYSSSGTNSSSSNGSMSTTLLTCFLFLIVIFLVGFLLNTDFDFVSHHPPHTIGSVVENDGIARSLVTKFKSLEYPLSNSKLVGLYFAASWCPMSTSVTQSLEEIFSQKSVSGTNSNSNSNRVLTTNNNNQEDHVIVEMQKNGQTIKDFSLVYVSSDTSAEEMKNYMKWNWIGIPFDSPDRNEIKRYFRTCAQNEMQKLGMESRRFQIPTLLVLDSVTQDIISTNGVADLETYGEEVLDHWLEIQSLMRALEDKYA